VLICRTTPGNCIFGHFWFPKTAPPEGWSSLKI
jgi:hypothetical protein